MTSEYMETLNRAQSCDVPIHVDMLDAALEAAVQADNIIHMQQILQRYKNLPSSSQEVPAPAGILAHDSICNWTPTTLSHLLHHCARTQNLEYMLLLFMTTQTYKLPLTEASLSFIVQCCSDAREPRLAWDIVRQVDQISKVSAIVWMRVLRACAEHVFSPGIVQAWNRSVVEGGIEPDHGLVAQVLLTASRAGLDKLVDQVFETIKEPDELVLVPVLDTYSEVSRFEDAFHVLSRMHALGIPLQPPLLAHLTSMVSLNHETLQSACHALLQHNKPVSTEVWNVLIYAAASWKDLHLSETLVQRIPAATVTTYQAWLLCCVNSQNITAGKKVWESLLCAGLAPSSICYERMIRLHLMQPNYEEAFLLLEEAKRLGLVPTRRTYASMIWTCLKGNDERWRMLLKEMREANYEPGERLRQMLQINMTTTTHGA